MRFVFILAALLAFIPAVFAEEAAPAVKEGTVKLNAKTMIFDRAKGDIHLEGDVVVTRVINNETLVINCAEMDAKMVQDKIENVFAKGNVKLTTQQYKADATTAQFDFEKGIIILIGDKAKPAVVTSQGMVSTGPKIIFYTETERVEMPEGGDTIIELKDDAVKSDKKDAPKEQKPVDQP